MQIPTFDQIAELPTALALTVPDSYLDLNGHMNVRYYTTVHDDGLIPLVEELGFGAAYIEATRLSLFHVENHIRYLAEVRGGEEVSVHQRVLGRTHKAVSVMSFLLNRSTHAVSNLYECVMLHVDLETRRTLAFDPAHAELLDRRIEEDRRISWAPPVRGCIALTR